MIFQRCLKDGRLLLRGNTYGSNKKFQIDLNNFSLYKLAITAPGSKKNAKRKISNVSKTHVNHICTHSRILKMSILKSLLKNDNLTEYFSKCSTDARKRQSFKEAS